MATEATGIPPGIVSAAAKAQVGPLPEHVTRLQFEGVEFGQLCLDVYSDDVEEVDVLGVGRAGVGEDLIATYS